MGPAFWGPAHMKSHPTSAPRAMGWRVALQDLCQNVLSCWENKPATSLALPGPYKQMPFSSINQNSVARDGLFEDKVLFGSKLPVAMLSWLPACLKSSPLPQPQDDSGPHPAPFFWGGIFIFQQNLGKCKNKLVSFGAGNQSATPSSASLYLGLAGGLIFCSLSPKGFQLCNTFPFFC